MTKRLSREQLVDMSWRAGNLGYPGLLYPDAQTRLYKWVHDWKERYPDEAGPLVWNCHRGLGKALSLSSKVLTPTGWTTMGQIQLGDEVLTPTGKVAKVVGIFPQGEKDLYTITFHDGTTVDCCLEHLWQVNICEGRVSHSQSKNMRWAKPKSKVVSTKELLEYLNQQGTPGFEGRPAITVPLVSPIEKPEATLPLHPYLLGVLLGDGSIVDSVRLTSADQFIIDKVGQLLPPDVEIKRLGKTKYDYSITRKVGCSNSVKQAIAILGLNNHRSHDKFIPDIYKNTSINQRLELIQGLMDTDGTADRSVRHLLHRDHISWHPTFTTISYRLALDVCEVIWSLGGLVTIHTRHTQCNGKDCGLAYTLHISMPCPKSLFSLPRKKDKCLESFGNGKRVLSRRVKSIKYKGREEAQCITVDSPESLYVTNDYIVTHNSTLLVTLAIERCLRYPGQIVRYGAPSFTQCQEIVTPLIDWVLRDCPEDLRPTVRGGNEYVFRNPQWGDPNAKSTLWLIGCREGGIHERGKRSNMVVLDEVRDIDRPRYVVEDVFGSHFISKERPLFILSSTPPDSMSHYYKTCCEEARDDNRYFKVRNIDNKDWTDKNELVIVKQLHGNNTIAYRREMLCELVSDPTRLAVPEFLEVKPEIVKNTYPRPSHFYPFLGIDLGAKDYTAVLFGYLDFQNQKLVIEDEIVKHNLSTGVIAELIKSKEQQLYNDPKNRSFTPLYKWIRRFSDNNAQQLLDFRRDHDLYMSPADKWDKWASLANLKTGIQQKKIVILEKCTNLIGQLEDGALNEKRTDFSRQDINDVEPDSPIMGHCDAVVALMYLYRMIHPYWLNNPFPAEGYNSERFYSRPIEVNSGITITHKPLVMTRNTL